MKHTTLFRNGTHTPARASRWLAMLALAGLAFTTAPAFAQAPPAMDSLTFEQVAKMRRTQATLYSPVRLVDNQSISIHLLTAYTPARVAGGEHGVRVIVYVVKPDLSGFEVLSSTTEPTSAAAGGGGGAGKVSMHDISWSTIPKSHLAADGSAHLVVAVVGYNIARTGANASTTAARALSLGESGAFGNWDAASSDSESAMTVERPLLLRVRRTAEGSVDGRRQRA